MKRETGASPVRARRCKKFHAADATAESGKAQSVITLSQKTCLYPAPDSYVELAKGEEG